MCRVSAKSLCFLGNISFFGDSGKRKKLQHKDKILGRNEKCIICMGKLNAKPGKLTFRHCSIAHTLIYVYQLLIVATRLIKMCECA